jgi:predicted dehydrogenase
MVDLAMWLADDFSPVQVSGVVRTAHMVDTDVDDFASALIRLRGGATIALESTWESFTRPALSVSVFGTQGGALVDLTQPPGKRLTLFGADGNTLLETVPVDIQLPIPVETSVQEHFIDCLRTHRRPDNSAERGLAVMRVLDAVYQSSATGCDVTLG